MKRIILLTGVLLSFGTPALAYHDIEYIPGTIPGCDRINGVYVCQDGRGNRWIPLPKRRERIYREYAPTCGASSLSILGIPILGTVVECQ
jgi:hypothetical protein